MAAPTPQLRSADYQLVSRLGRGGMGEVWKANDLKADRQVALKFIRRDYLDNPEVRKRFLTEARTLGRLEHDRIVTLYNVLDDGENLALVLRFIDGNSLGDRIDENGAQPLEFVFSSARDILPALGFAHSRGVIHRDIKAPNILVDTEGRSFLTDFGIAAVEFTERGTQFGTSVGTPHYMSPEQIKTPREITMENKGYRSDIYSYGVLLYEMLTGILPFGGNAGPDETFVVQRAHCDETPVPLRQIKADIPASVEEVVLHCLAKSPDDRPQSCKELLEEFEAAMSTGARPKRRTYSETVIEPQPSRPAEPKPSPSVVPAPAPKKGLRVPVLVGSAVVVAVAGISSAIYFSRNTATPDGGTSTRKDTHAVIKDTGGDLPPVTKGGGSPQPPSKGTPPVPPQPNPKLAMAESAFRQAQDTLQGDSCNGVGLIETALQADPKNSKYLALRAQLGDACAERRKAAAAAAQAVQQARGLLAQKQYCQGKAVLDNALKGAAAQPDLSSLQNQLDKGCEAEHTYDTAQEQFKTGQYCEGMDTIDPVVKADPTNAKYAKLRASLAKGCPIHVP